VPGSRQAAGADGLLVVSPYYSRPTQEGLFRHFSAVADATDLPVMLYDIPGRAGVRIAPETFVRIAEHPRIVANKDATGDVWSAAQLIEATGLAWYSGDDGLLLPFLSVGGAGIVSVSAHVVAAQFAEVIRRWDAGDHAAALDAFRRTTPVVGALNGAGAQAVMTKAALQAQGVLEHRPLRLPNVAASDHEVATLRAVLTAAGLLPQSATPMSPPELPEEATAIVGHPAIVTPG
jgi:4-hydroxy-tetrahydrodipicolinate synthase